MEVMLGIAFVIGKITRYVATEVAIKNGKTEEEAEKIGKTYGFAVGAFAGIMTLDVSSFIDIAAVAGGASA